MECSICGNPEMIKKTVDETLSLSKQSLTLHNMCGYFCESCGEGILDEKSYHRFVECQAALIRSESK